MATIASLESTTRSARILESIKDQKSGRPRSGWAAGDELKQPPEPERVGPSLLPFLRHRRGDVWWRVGLGFLYVPVIIVLITVEGWMGLPDMVIWMTLGVFLLAFVGFVFLSDRLMRGD